MPEVGKTISHYRILEKIGEGGMGQVYLADDLSLGRKVALKFVSDVFTGDPDRMARFEREAKLLASLNHPNIAAIYGFEQADGKRFLVLEYVEGETLQARLSKGALPVDDVLGVCRQIAEGLEAAHEKGVIHRDLKPANVMITAEEKVKILDFGLAKALADEIQSIDSSQSPTITETMTQPGVLLGTAAYMSPEQAKGKAVDKRADIWAFGCILYECLTNRRAFGGKAITDIFGAIIHMDPNWEVLPKDAPGNISILLQRCCAKDPRERLRDIGDARIEIEDILKGSTEMLRLPAGTVRRRGWREKAPWILAGVLAVTVALSTWRPWRMDPLENLQTIRTRIPMPAPGLPSLALSPDGSRLVHEYDGGLYLRKLDEEEATLIPGTEGAHHPFFGPEGKWIGFFAGDKMKKAPLDGVGAVELCTTVPRGGRGGSWGSDGIIIYAHVRSGLWKMPASGGSPEVLTTLDLEKGEISHRWPQVLPNGKFMIFTVYSGGSYDDASIVAQSLETDERTFLIHGRYARYVPSGHLIYAREGDLYAVRFDPDRLEVTGSSVPVQVGISMEDGNGYAYFTISKTGLLIFVPRQSQKNSLFLVDLQGKAGLLAAPQLSYLAARFSPDNQRLALVTSEGSIHLYEPDHDRLSLLTSQFEDSSGTVWTPFSTSIAWNPNGKSLAFSARQAGSLPSLFSMPLDSSAPPEPLHLSPKWHIVDSWAPDGKSLLFTENTGASWNILELPLEGDHKPRPILEAQDSQVQPVFSPDGRWIAYASNESGQFEVYIRPYDRPGGRQQVSNDGGLSPVWAPDGGTLFYRNGNSMMAVDVNLEDIATCGPPRLLFEERYLVATGDIPRTYDISPDGRNFVMIQSVEGNLPTQFHAVLNWFEELKERVPMK